MKTIAARKPSQLKAMAERAAAKEIASEPEPTPAVSPSPERSWRTAQTRSGTRQISGHFSPEVAQTLRVIAAEQDREVQEMLAEALNMLFARFGKPVRADVTSGRRKS